MTAIPDDSRRTRVTVPGAVDAWCRLVADHGRLGAGRRSSRPPSAPPRTGIVVTPRVALDWARYADRLAAHAAAAGDSAGRRRARDRATRMRHPALGATLRAHRAGRARVRSTRARSAEEIVAVLHGRGGLHALEDFAAQRSD